MAKSLGGKEAEWQGVWVAMRLSGKVFINPCTEDLYLQGPKQVSPVPPETFFKNS